MRTKRRIRRRQWYFKAISIYNTYKDVLAVVLVVLAVLATGVHNYFSNFEELYGYQEYYIADYQRIQQYVYGLGFYIACTLLTLASFVAWPTRTNRFTKSVMGVVGIFFLIQTFRRAKIGGELLPYLESLSMIVLIGLVIFLIFLGRVMFLRVDDTDHRLLIRTLRKNKELENLIYKISHDAFMAEVSRAKGWLELIKLKKNEIHDPELLKYLEGLEGTFTNMRKKTNSLMNINPDKFKDFVDTDSKPDSLK